MTTNPFATAAPASGGGGDYPANHQLVGRLVIFWVVGYNQGVESGFDDPKNPGQRAKQDQLIADTAVLDGPPITGKVDWHTRQEVPFPFPLGPGIEFEGMTWSQKVLITQLRPHLNTGQPVLGRLYYGEKRGNYSPPIKLQDPTPQEIQQGIQYLQNRDAMKAQWAARFAQAGQPQQIVPAPTGNPFGQPPAYGTPQPQQQGVPQWQPQPAPVQDQPWNPYNGQQQAPAQPGFSTANGPDAGPGTPQPGAWTPTPDGPPAGWPGAQQ